MLIQIGHHREHDPTDVVGPLLDCHARIRAFTAIAQRIAAREGTLAEVAGAAGLVERYFRVALPLHVDDEERSLGSRLLAAPVAPGVLLAIEAMTDEHEVLERLVAGLLPRWAELAERPSELASLASLLAEDTGELRRRCDAHLEDEERVLFPAVREHLRADARAIREEMIARRAGAPASRA